MKRFASAFLLIVLYTFSTPSFAADLKEEDKATHAQASAGVSMVSYGAFRAAKFGKVSSSLLSFTVAMTVGHIKESTDPFYDKRDMEANALGASVGLLIPLSFTF